MRTRPSWHSRLKDEAEYSVEGLCEMLGVGRSTVYRYLGEAEKEGDNEEGREIT